MGPAAAPVDGGELHRRPPRDGVIRMEDDQVFTLGAAVHQQAFTAGPKPFSIGIQQRRPAAIGQRHARSIEVGPGDRLRAADRGVIRAARAPAAEIPRREEIAEAPVADDERSLDSLPVRRQGRLRGRARVGSRVWRGGGSGRGGGGLVPARKRVECGVRAGEQASGVVKPAHLDSIPEAPEAKPRVALLVERKVGVDGVEVVARLRFEDEPLVDPAVLGAGAVEGLVDGERDAGGVLSEQRV